MKKDKQLQKVSLQTKYLLKTMSLFIDQILKWQWKHYIMFEKNKNIYLTIYKKVKNSKNKNVR